jgi:hypothetical protein
MPRVPSWGPPSWRLPVFGGSASRFGQGPAGRGLRGATTDELAAAFASREDVVGEASDDRWGRRASAKVAVLLFDERGCALRPHCRLADASASSDAGAGPSRCETPVCVGKAQASWVSREIAPGRCPRPTRPATSTSTSAASASRRRRRAAAFGPSPHRPPFRRDGGNSCRRPHSGTALKVERTRASIPESRETVVSRASGRESRHRVASRPRAAT